MSGHLVHIGWESCHQRITFIIKLIGLWSFAPHCYRNSSHKRFEITGLSGFRPSQDKIAPLCGSSEILGRRSAEGFSLSNNDANITIKQRTAAKKKRIDSVVTR